MKDLEKKKKKEIQKNINLEHFNSCSFKVVFFLINFGTV